MLSSSAQVMASLSAADPQEQQRLTQKVRVERAERAVAAAYKGLASLPETKAWQERIEREEAILRQEKNKYLTMGGVLEKKIKPPGAVQSTAAQKPAAAAASRVIAPAQRTDAVLFLAKIAILEKLRVDDPKRQQFIQDEMKKQKILTGQSFDPEKQYTLEKFLEKHGTLCEALKSTKIDSVENVGIEAMAKARQLIGNNSSSATEITRDIGVEYANRIKDKIQSTENTSAVANAVSSPRTQGFGRG